MRAKDALGRYGEQLAERHLTAAGMELLDRNWRCELGEIDLVLRDGAELVVCEVKTRRSTLYGTPLEAVSLAKLQRLHRLGYRWLQEHDGRTRSLRVDVIGVLVPRNGPPEIEYVRDMS